MCCTFPAISIVLAIVLSLSVCSCISGCVSDGAAVDVEFMYESIVFRCVLCCPRTPRCYLDFGFGFAGVVDLGWLSLRCSWWSGPFAAVSFVVLLFNLF